MAKQRSGLGRGLNALFDSAESPAKPADEAKKNPEVPTEKQTPASEPVASKPENTVQTEAAPQPTAQQKSSEPAHDIVFSEDALENAKVIEREARPAQKTAPAKPHKRKPVKPSLSESLAQSRAARREKEDAQRPQSTAAPAQSVPVQPKTATAAPVAEAKAAKPAFYKPLQGEVGELPIGQIQPNPNQPRTSFKKEDLEELANSIKKDGLLQPILVRKSGDHYEIIAGERRYQACRMLNMETIPVRYWLADNDKALELALIENIQRSDLNPIEEAYGYKRLMERKGMTQSEVAQTVAKGRSTIANALRLLDLPEEAQQMLFEEKITAGHARAILSIPTAEGRKSLTNKLLEEKLSVREAESIARLLSGKANQEGETPKRQPAPPSFKKAARGLSRYLGTPVKVKTVQGKNKIEIQFQTEEDLQRIVDAISAAQK